MDGTSKEMLMYGGRIAGITLGIHPSWVSQEDRIDFENEWDNKLQGMIRSTISNANRFCQEVLTGMMKDGFNNIISSRQKVIDILKQRYNTSISTFNKLNNPNISIDPAGGGFFVFLNIKDIPADKLANHLLEKYKVGTFPVVNPKEGINGIRVAYCSIPLDKIEECFKRIDLAVRYFL